MRFRFRLPVRQSEVIASLREMNANRFLCHGFSICQPAADHQDVILFSKLDLDHDIGNRVTIDRGKGLVRACPADDPSPTGEGSPRGAEAVTSIADRAWRPAESAAVIAALKFELTVRKRAPIGFGIAIRIGERALIRHCQASR